MRIAVDAMGGDNAPAVEVAGAVAAAREFAIPILLVGDTESLRAELAKHPVSGLDITIHHASEVVGMHDSASDAIRKKKDSSIRVAFEQVKQGKADAVVSAGNSGATMAAGMFVLKRLKGIDRPAIAQIFPTLRGQTVVLDVGGNVDCKPVHLVQFAIMGEVYARYVMGITHPRSGILSNGEEAGKGSELVKEAFPLLQSAKLNFFGNVEGKEIFGGKVDVAVTDGFTGNVFLKSTEAVAKLLIEKIREAIKGGGPLALVGGALIRPAMGKVRK